MGFRVVLTDRAEAAVVQPDEEKRCQECPTTGILCRSLWKMES